MRWLPHIATTDLTHERTMPDNVRTELITWAQIAATNAPVAVWVEEMEPEYTVYCDASATGWGAISITKEGSILQLAQQWTTEDVAQWNVFSSVAAEPLALRKAVAALIPRTARSVTVYTDHLPLVFAAEKSFGKAYAYSAAIQFLNSYHGTTFVLKFVPGESNPADILSRARSFPDAPRPAPLLRVTSVGGCTMTGGRGMGDEGKGRDAGFFRQINKY